MIIRFYLLTLLTLLTSSYQSSQGGETPYDTHKRSHTHTLLRLLLRFQFLYPKPSTSILQ